MLKICMGTALLLLSMTSMAQARDLSALQTAVQVSRQVMEGAKSDYDADAQQVAASRKNMENARKQFAQSQQKASESQKKYQQAKARYERAQTALDNAWKQ